MIFLYTDCCRIVCIHQQQIKKVDGFNSNISIENKEKLHIFINEYVTRKALDNPNND